MELHEYFKQKFIEPETKQIFDETVFIYTTTDKGTAQFKEYLDKIQIFASSELGIDLPDPESLRWEEFESYYHDR